MTIRSRLSSESGMTLIELAFVTAVLGIVLTSFLGTFDVVQRQFGTQLDRSAGNDQARLAVEEIDREVRSGNLLYDPSLESTPGMMLRVYTQTNAPTRDPSNRCVQWKIQNKQLLVRNWSVAWETDGVVTGWRIVAEDIVNQSNNPQTPAFALDGEASKGGRTLNVVILVNANPVSGRDVRIQTSVTGRNTEYGYPTNICDDIPQG